MAGAQPPRWPITGSIAERRHSSFNDSEHATLLSRDEDAARIFRAFVAEAFVDIAPLDLAGEFFGLVDHVARVCRRKNCAAAPLHDELTTRARALVVTIETLTPNS